jgi:nitrous oxidase accessory protein
VVVSAPDAVLSALTIRQAWSGVWIDRANRISIDKLNFVGLADFPFWQRGEGVRVTGSNDIQLRAIDLAATEDGVYLEQCRDVVLTNVKVEEARYALHSMFSSDGRVAGLQSRMTVAGVMIMESSHWSITASSFLEGYRIGSAGVREIRTKGIRIQTCHIGRQAAGIELLDTRDGLFEGNLIEENGIAWTWGGDNSGTFAQENTHRGNLMDVAGTEPKERDLNDSEAHHHGPAVALRPTVLPSSASIRPTFDRNYWDGWHGLDLNGDGTGDTPYRFDAGFANQTASRPWSGIFLGSPLSELSQTLPGGEILDRRPLTAPPRRSSADSRPTQGSSGRS